MQKDSNISQSLKMRTLHLGAGQEAAQSVTQQYAKSISNQSQALFGWLKNVVWSAQAFWYNT